MVSHANEIAPNAGHGSYDTTDGMSTSSRTRSLTGVPECRASQDAAPSDEDGNSTRFVHTMTVIGKRPLTIVMKADAIGSFSLFNDRCRYAIAPDHHSHDSAQQVSFF